MALVPCVVWRQPCPLVSLGCFDLPGKARSDRHARQSQRGRGDRPATTCGSSAVRTEDRADRQPGVGGCGAAARDCEVLLGALSPRPLVEWYKLDIHTPARVLRQRGCVTAAHDAKYTAPIGVVAPPYSQCYNTADYRVIPLKLAAPHPGAGRVVESAALL